MAYIEKLTELGLTLERGKFHHVAIRHDSCCSYWKTGQCNCDAEVERMDGPPKDWGKTLRERFKAKRRARGKA